MDAQKLAFITTAFPALVKAASPTTVASWGKMNFQQMIEHVSDFFKVSTNKIQLPFVSNAEHLPKLREFLLSDKPFRENTKAPAAIIPDEPLPVRNESIEVAISKLEKQINDFVVYFEQHKDAVTKHPVFGPLNFNEWILLHYKHVQHHCKQFGLI